MNIVLFGKKIIASILYHYGIVDFIRYMNQDSNIILAYHRVLPRYSDDLKFIQPGMYVTTDTFERHMSYISQNYNVIGIEDLLTQQKPKNACVVTFDDGWVDNYNYAFPILRKYGIPAIIFISTNMIGTNQWHWTDRICYYVYTVDRNKFMDVLISGLNAIGVNYSKILSCSYDNQTITEVILNYMKNLDYAKITTLMSHIDHSLIEQFMAMNKERPWLSWGEILEMSRHEITFGAHTHNHVILTSITLPEVREEISFSKDILNQKLGKTVEAFCYPNGNYNKAIIGIVQECKFNLAVTTQKGLVNKITEPFALPRIMIHDDMTSSLPMFACILTNKVPFF